jgi:hypothetical protein
MSVIDFQREKLNRRYKNMNIIMLMEEMDKFLELHPCPINNSKILKEGIELFNNIYIKALTIELKTIASEYSKMYHYRFMDL